MARDSRQSHIPESRAAQALTRLQQQRADFQTLRMQALLVIVLGGALIWVWWRRRIEALWQQPQHAPLSAQWLNAH